MTRPTFDVSLLTTGHDVADARLHRLVALLLASGLSVEVHGLGSPSDGPPGAEVATRPRRSLGRRSVRAVLLPWAARGRVLIILDPDLALPALVRSRVARRDRPCSVPASRLVVDVHEDYAKLLLDRTWAKGLRMAVARLVVVSASWAAARADLTLVADDHLPPLRARCRAVVPNLPDLDMLPTRTAPDSAPRAVYVGDVRRSRGLQSMLAVLEASPDWSLDVVGPVATADQSWLDRWRATSPARHRVTFHGRRPPRDALQLASRAWVGLCLLEPTPAFVAALPSKIHEYLACGLAVLTTPLARASELVTKAGAGAVVEDADAAAAVLRSWSANPTTVRTHQAAARVWAEANLPGTGMGPDVGAMVARLARTAHR